MKAIVLVEWDDASMSTESHWQAGTPAPAPPEDTLAVSVGFVISRTRKSLLLVQSLTEGSYAHKIEIPRAMIRSITTLEKRPVPPLAPAPQVDSNGSSQSD